MFSIFTLFSVLVVGNIFYGRAVATNRVRSWVSKTHLFLSNVSHLLSNALLLRFGLGSLGNGTFLFLLLRSFGSLV